MRVILPHMTPVPHDASPEERKRMFDDYCRELTVVNPGAFDNYGSLIPWWKRLIGIFGGKVA